MTAIDDRLELLPQIRLLYAGPNLRAYTLESWRPYRFFAARPTTSSFRNRARRTGSVDLSDRSAFSAIVKRRPLPYRVEGVGRFTVDTSSLRPGELLVMNQPFERTWRAGGLRPVALDPGLTAFEVGQHAELVVTNTLEERFAWLLVTLPVTLLGCAASLGVGLVRRRRKGRNP